MTPPKRVLFWTLGLGLAGLTVLAAHRPADPPRTEEPDRVINALLRAMRNALISEETGNTPPPFREPVGPPRGSSVAVHVPPERPFPNGTNELFNPPRGGVPGGAERQLLDLLERRCAACHGAGNRVVERLNVRQMSSLEEGKYVVQGQPSQSEIWRRAVMKGDMPPRRLRPLSKQEQGDLKGLIASLPPKRKGKSIVETVQEDPELAFLYRVAEVSGVINLLEGPGPFTVLAPTNGAFAKLGKLKCESLTDRSHAASTIPLLLNHGIRGEYSAEELEALGRTLSAYSLPLTIARNPRNKEELWIGPVNAVVVKRNIQCSNGVIHKIDLVLEPPDLSSSFGSSWVMTKIGLKMLKIPGGKFTMGSPPPYDPGMEHEGPQREVQISTFYLAEHEVTSKMYQDLDMPNPAPDWIRQLPPDQHPMGTVTWVQAAEFCNALSRLEGYDHYYEIVEHGETVVVTVRDPGGTGYRLPTEAEWEYAARAGSAGKFCFGDDEAILSKYAWYGELGGVHPVRMKQPNDWGLYDMYGNVAEWCDDWYDPYQQGPGPLVDPRGPSTPPPGKEKVYRGGSHFRPAQYCRSAWRGSAQIRFAFPAIGFRVARTPESGKAAIDLPFPIPSRGQEE